MAQIISGEVNIGKFEGNLIEGFTVSNIEYINNDTIIFSAGKIYIDPDLSNLLFGNVTLSEVVIHNADYYYLDMPTNYLKFESIKNKYPINIDINSLKIFNSSIYYKEQLYTLDGHIGIAYNNQLNIQFDNFTIDSPKFDSELTIRSGSTSLFGRQLIMNNIILSSTWLSGRIDITMNLNNLSESFSNIELDKIHLQVNGSRDLKINNLRLNINESSKLVIEEISYQNIQLNEIEINGVIKEDIIIGKYAFRKLNKQFEGEGELSYDSQNWEALMKFDDFKMDNKTKLSGSLKLISPYSLDSLIINVDLHDTLIDSIRFNSIVASLSVAIP